ncbi:MAG: molybdenum cofactor biosynthesis protein MoaB [Candidatus Methanoliparum thermophilum]|uniref:Molybdenum cofactor biosynthesis protein MoaB n=1 Tax=Methanoliparum thermophilum TaxID=2491083 RepID=A0A520KRL0_METT2|nr:molybdenum cofactor biosynthesis protein B [Candidatus Methanoliparum sp. LAM-1]RZN64047.1 MAG: molybdenum cofactor biosynthesis protein MoaB [Candidatus Methanoliparum thermophilum]
MSSEDHKKDAKKDLKYGIITVSSSRYSNYKNVSNPSDAKDVSGEIMQDLIEKAKSDLVLYKLVPDDIDMIDNALSYAIESDAEVILISGGTGLAKKDLTIETASKYYEKKIDGFGELFRYLSFEEIGSAAILSRASAGIVRDKVIFVMPGSPNAVKLAMKQLILKEAPHILRHIKKG